jgi:predicted MFS family arabinose efflux permease
MGAEKMSNGGGLSLSEVVRRQSFWLMIAILFLFAAASYSVHTHLVPHAIDMGIPSVKAATLLSTIGIGSILGRLVMGKASDSIGSRWGMFISAVLLGIAMFWLIISSNLRMLYPFTLAFGFAFGATAPLNAALIGDLFGLRHVGLIMAVIEMGWESGAALGPAVAGYAFDVLGLYFHVFLGGAVAALISAALILMLEKKKRWV